jgi:hypothetical protein
LSGLLFQRLALRPGLQEGAALRRRQVAVRVQPPASGSAWKRRDVPPNKDSNGMPKETASR